MLIEAQNIEARYGSVQALSQLSFDMRKGEILAVLGPNGSGKTTLFRLLLGLLSPSSGVVELFGAPPGALPGLDRIGATIEWPSLYGHLTALENMEITALLKGKLNRSEWGDLLEEVGLDPGSRQPVSTYSLGMRQRLALGQALMGQPELLILDEPANGLDPAGIRWFREWVATLPRTRGVSVILSSHLLHEVSQVADRVLLLKEGQLKFSGTLEELRRRGQHPFLRVVTTSLSTSGELLEQSGYTVDRMEGCLRVHRPADELPGIARTLVAANQDILFLGPEPTSLEEIYLAMMEEA
jgi:ABC-2 type transport system ATP-binding protein